MNPLCYCLILFQLMLPDFRGGYYLQRRGKAFYGFSVYSLKRGKRNVPDGDSCSL